MPKNSRPDIQVLEARVVRLKAQLLEYKEIRTYEITKQRLSNVARELEECVSIIDSITEDSNVPVPHIVTLQESDNPNVDEFSDDGDLADVLFLEPSDNDNQKPVDPFGYPPKYIVSHYAKQLEILADTPTGIIQVNQLGLLLNSWFRTRFIPDVKHPGFHYRASRIHEWIDLIIIAAGSALNQGTFSDFKAKMDEWIQGLNTSKDENWILPLRIVQIEEQDGVYTKEAILAEKIIKSILYTSKFYSAEKDSVARIVMKNTGYTEDELTMEALLEACPRLIPTSTFDVTKYQ